MRVLQWDTLVDGALPVPYSEWLLLARLSVLGGSGLVLQWGALVDGARALLGSLCSVGLF